ncbi:hypothetical protein HY732_04760 [Candidatus Uhrbacteria bacterium]|nr:hypothetical protein [Candidatus Uhrbacteria bacterium]
MIIVTTKPLDRDYGHLSADIQKRLDAKLAIFITNPLHPSLRSKKMEDPRGIWEVSITMNYRFTFARAGDTIILRRVGTHDVLRNP